MFKLPEGRYKHSGLVIWMNSKIQPLSSGLSMMMIYGANDVSNNYGLSTGLWQW